MEKVLVVPTNIICKFLNEKDFVTDNISEIIEAIKKNHNYILRDTAEYEVEYKQIIPYAVLTNGDSIYVTQRLKGQTEKRLHGMYSIGLGGHINPQEEKSEDVIYAGICRELDEEVGIKNIGKFICSGIINDSSAGVSNFHIGLLYFIAAPQNIHILETEKMSGMWIKKNELKNYEDKMEGWSKIVLRYAKELNT